MAMTGGVDGSPYAKARNSHGTYRAAYSANINHEFCQWLRWGSDAMQQADVCPHSYDPPTPADGQT